MKRNQADTECTISHYFARDVIGEVQKGERIVGTGDVVTPEIYQVLEG